MNIKNLDFLNIIDRFPDSICITDTNAIVVYINEVFTKVTGYTKEDIIGKNINILKSGNMSNQFYREMWITITSGKIWRGKIYNKKKNGAYFWEDTIIIPLYENNNLIGYISIKKDITEDIKNEEVLRKNNLNKSKLFSIISHDLKNHFFASLGYNELLYYQLDNLNNEEIKFYIHNSYKLLKQIDVLLTNLLNWSKLQIGAFSYNNIKINLFEFVEFIFELLKYQSEHKNIKLSNNIKKDIFVYTDEKALYSVLYNLIHNSIKFTNIGGNVVVCENKSQYSDDDVIYVSVIDDGIGMTYDNISKLFTLESQYTTYGTNNETGSGLGLIIVKEFLDNMKSKFEIKSEVNKGTEFTFSLNKYKD